MLFEIDYSRKPSLYMNLEQTPEGGEESHVDMGDQWSTSAKPWSAEYIERGIGWGPVWLEQR